MPDREDGTGSASPRQQLTIRSAFGSTVKRALSWGVAVDAWDRHRLLEDRSRTFAEAGINIVEARCIVSHPMFKNRFVVEVGDTQALKGASPGCARSARSSTPTAVTPTGD